MDTAASVTCGYLIIDLGSVIWYGIPPHYMEYFIFHVGILLCFMSYLVNQTGGMGCMVGLVGDLFAIALQHQTEVDRCFKVYQGYIHWFQFLHEWFVVLVMFVTRVLPCTYIVYLVANDPDWPTLDLVADHVWVVFLQAAMMAFMLVMTLYFAALTIHDAWKTSKKTKYFNLPDRVKPEQQEKDNSKRRYSIPPPLSFSPSVTHEFLVEHSNDTQDWTHVQGALLGVHGVNSALLTNRHATITTNPRLSANSVIKAVRDKGFDLVLIHQNSFATPTHSPSSTQSASLLPRLSQQQKGNLQTPTETTLLIDSRNALREGEFFTFP